MGVRLLKNSQGGGGALDIPLLVSTDRPIAAAVRHIMRLERHKTDKPPLRMPKQRAGAALSGVAMVGLVIEQQEALLAALSGEYLQKYYAEEQAILYEEHPRLIPLFEDKRVSLADMRAIYLAEITRPELLESRLTPLHNIYQAWQLRQAVVFERQPLNLASAPTTALTQSDLFTFTPVVQRVGVQAWQLGRGADRAPVSPHIIEGDVPQVWEEILATYADWCRRDGLWWIKLHEQKAQKVSHICLPLWAERLKKGSLSFGPVEATNLSHANLFKLLFGDGQQVILRKPVTYVTALCLTLGQAPALSDAAAIQAHYLGGSLLKKTRPVPQAAKPFAYCVREAYNLKEENNTVSWFDHQSILALVSHPHYPLRAVLMFDPLFNRFGVTAVDYKSRQPKTSEIWASTPADEFPIQRAENRLALSAWLISQWRQRCEKKAHQPGQKKGQKT